MSTWRNIANDRVEYQGYASDPGAGLRRRGDMCFMRA